MHNTCAARHKVPISRYINDHIRAVVYPVVRLVCKSSIVGLRLFSGLRRPITTVEEPFAHISIEHKAKQKHSAE